MIHDSEVGLSRFIPQVCKGSGMFLLNSVWNAKGHLINTTSIQRGRYFQEEGY